MGIYDEKLGEYKVALSVDYKKFHEGMKSAMDLMTETAGTMNRTAENLSAVLALHFDTMTKTVNTGVESMKADINSLTEMLKGGNDIKGFSNSLETELKRITEKYKAAVKEIQTEIGKTVNVPDSGSSGGGKSSDSVSEYTKRTRLRSKGASEVAETGAVSDETIKAYNEVDTNIKKSETSLNAIRKAQNDLNKLAEQYNAIQQKVANTITAQGKLSETTLASYRSQIANIVQEHQRLRSMIGDKATDDFVVKGFLPNLLEKGGAYEQNAKKVDDGAREQKRIADLKKVEAQYVKLYETILRYIQTSTRMSEMSFLKMNQDIDKLIAKMQALGRNGSIENPLAKFGRDYNKYLDLSGFNKSIDTSIAKTNVLADGLLSLKHHITWLMSASLLGATLAIPTASIATIKEVEKLMAGMKQVNHDVATSQTVLAKTTQQLIGISDTYAQKVDDIIKAATLWGRGYKDLDTVMRLTSLSAKLSIADMVDVGLANRAVESVINSYQKQGEAVEFATHVVDSWTKIAHNAQASAQDLAEALMRTGAAAKAVGIDFDTTNALAASMIKATGMSGAEIGRHKIAA